VMERVNFTVYVQFAYSSGNQLGVLRSEVKDQNHFGHAAKIAANVFMSRYRIRYF